MSNDQNSRVNCEPCGRTGDRDHTQAAANAAADAHNNMEHRGGRHATVTTR